MFVVPLLSHLGSDKAVAKYIFTFQAVCKIGLRKLCVLPLGVAFRMQRQLATRSFIFLFVQAECIHCPDALQSKLVYSGPGHVDGGSSDHVHTTILPKYPSPKPLWSKSSNSQGYVCFPPNLTF